LKLCYVINLYPKPSHSFIRREILALEQHGAQILRVAFRGWDEAAADSRDAAEQALTRYTLRSGLVGLGVSVCRNMLGRPIRFLEAASQAWHLGRNSDKALWRHVMYLAESCVVADEVRSFGATHIHAHFGTNSAEVALLAALLADVPFSFTVHGPEEFDKPAALHLQRKIQRAARVVAVSSYGRSQLYRWAESRDWEKIRVVHCGLDAQFTQMPEPQPAAATGTLVCVGRICEQKGQLLLLEALRIVLDRSVDARLVMAGDGPMRRQIEERAATLGVADRVRITGWIDGAQVRSEILAARALVLPSFAEGLPVVIMEAMALGRPVISTYIAGIPELVLPSCGWLVPAGDVEALAGAMIECLATDEARLRDMGRAGRERALRRHDAYQEAGRLLQMFAEVAGE
jgi:colanic acid/amylovoran biosynthesis glycosyltransferase